MTENEIKRGSADEVEETQSDLAQEDGGSCHSGGPLDDTEVWRAQNVREWVEAGRRHGWTPREVSTLIRPEDWSEEEDGEAVKKTLSEM